MTPSDEELSSFVGELLKAYVGPSGFVITVSDASGHHSINITTFNLFESFNSPIIRDLIEGAMERRGIEMRVDNYTAKKGYGRRTRVYARKDSHEDSACWDWELADWYQEDANKTRAVALAAFNALEGKV